MSKCILILAVLSLLLCGCIPDKKTAPSADLKAMYDYRDTRLLVQMIRKAADLIAEQGTNAFAAFDVQDSEWDNPLFYIYVYDVDGLCLYHPSLPQLVGRNVIDIRDAEGKKSLQMALDAARDPDNPHGWVHYMWSQHHSIQPVPKSSCHFLTTMPDGRTVLVGGGLETPLEERNFAKFVVDSAVRLLNEEGANALPTIEDPQSKFRFRNVKVFVFTENGDVLIDPVMNRPGTKNIADLTDDAGNKPIELIVERLQSQDSCWVVMLVQNRYDRMVNKKGIYARRATMDGTNVIVAASTSLPKPVWSK
jgi:hypothetical protein